MVEADLNRTIVIQVTVAVRNWNKSSDKRRSCITEDITMRVDVMSVEKKIQTLLVDPV